MYNRCIITMKEQAFSLEVRSPQSQSHGNGMKFTPVNAHLLVLEGLLGKGTLTPLTLKVTTEALVTGISKKFHVWAAGPVCVVQVADPFPGWQVGHPPLDISLELCIQLDVGDAGNMPSWTPLSSCTGMLNPRGHTLQMKCSLLMRESISCLVANMACLKATSSCMIASRHSGLIWATPSCEIYIYTEKTSNGRGSL